jgi:hypothetical protein
MYMYSILPWCPFTISSIYHQDDWMHNNELSPVQRQLIWYSATLLNPVKMRNIGHHLKLLLIYAVYAYKYIYCRNIPWLNNAEVYLTSFKVLKITQLQDKSIYIIVLQLGFVKFQRKNGIFFWIYCTLYNVYT